MSTEKDFTIVCATDFSSQSDLVVSRGIDLAQRFGAKTLYLLHVAKAERFDPEHDAAARIEGQFARLELQANEQLAKMAEAVSPGSVSAIVPVVRAGDPYVEVVRFATEVHADLVVVGTHGRTGLRHAVLGSVAERVVRHAPCTVVVAKPRDLSAHVVAGFGLPYHTAP
jgi:nucleotide-binding universal stress UspA family protein